MKQGFSKHIGKQQYLYIALAILGMCFAGASLVLAEEATTNTEGQKTRPALFEERRKALDEKRASFEALKEEREGMMEEKRAEIQARIAERKAALGEAAQERITSLADTMTVRFTTVTTKLDDIISRIETRMDKLANEGVDTSEAKLVLEEAKQKLDEAEALMEGLDVEVSYTVTDEDPQTEWAATKETFRKIHTLIKEVRELLRQTVGALKEAAEAAALEADDGRTE